MKLCGYPSDGGRGVRGSPRMTAACMSLYYRKKALAKRS